MEDFRGVGESVRRDERMEEQSPAARQLCDAGTSSQKQKQKCRQPKRLTRVGAAGAAGSRPGGVEAWRRGEAWRGKVVDAGASDWPGWRLGLAGVVVDRIGIGDV